jgi:hypothetical protein
LPVAENVVSVLQDDSGSGGEDSNDLGSDDGEGSGSDDDEGSGSDDGKDKAMHIPFRMTPSGIMWYKCPVCLKEYDSEAKVVLHALEAFKQDVVEPHRQVLQTR